MAYDCGFSVEKFTEGYEQRAEGTKSTVSYNKQGCHVSGKGPEAKGIVIEADPNTNVLYPNASIPAVVYRIKKGEPIRLETRVETYV